MKGKLNLYYDEEGDFLEIQMGDIKDGSFNNLGEGIFERVDKKTNEITGIAIQSFRKRTQGLKGINISLPMDMKLIPQKQSKRPKD